jgi:hypothetical protein
MDIMELDNYDFGPSIVDDLGDFADSIPLLDLAEGIDGMGTLNEAMPTLAQSLGAGDDLPTSITHPEVIVSATSPSGKKTKRRKRSHRSEHRRSFSDPETLRHDFFHMPEPIAISSLHENAMLGEQISELLSMDEVTSISEAQQEPSPKAVRRRHRRSSSRSSILSASSSKSGRVKRSGRTRKSNYACSKCGQPKKGHVCPMAPKPKAKLKSAGTSTQQDQTGMNIKRVLVTRPFVSAFST